MLSRILALATLYHGLSHALNPCRRKPWSLVSLRLNLRGYGLPERHVERDRHEIHLTNEPGRFFGVGTAEKLILRQFAGFKRFQFRMYKLIPELADGFEFPASMVPKDIFAGQL